MHAFNDAEMMQMVASAIHRLEHRVHLAAIIMAEEKRF